MSITRIDVFKSWQTSAGPSCMLDVEDPDS